MPSFKSSSCNSIEFTERTFHHMMITIAVQICDELSLHQRPWSPDGSARSSVGIVGFLPGKHVMSSHYWLVVLKSMLLVDEL